MNAATTIKTMRIGKDSKKNTELNQNNNNQPNELQMQIELRLKPQMNIIEKISSKIVGFG